MRIEKGIILQFNVWNWDDDIIVFSGDRCYEEAVLEVKDALNKMIMYYEDNYEPCPRIVLLSDNGSFQLYSLNEVVENENLIRQIMISGGFQGNDFDFSVQFIGDM